MNNVFESCKVQHTLDGVEALWKNIPMSSWNPTVLATKTSFLFSLPKH
jgi:hypothetical protein